MAKISETQLFDVLKGWLVQRGFTCYGEVSATGNLSGGRVDLLATKNGHWLAFETKTSLSLKVIEQAYNWRDMVDQSYVVIPQRTMQGAYRASTTDAFVSSLGVGIIEVDPDNKPILGVNGADIDWVNGHLKTHILPVETRRYQADQKFISSSNEFFRQDPKTTLGKILNTPLDEINDLDVQNYAQCVCDDQSKWETKMYSYYDELWNWWVCRSQLQPETYRIADTVAPIQIKQFSRAHFITAEQKKYWQDHVCHDMKKTQGGHVSENANYLTPWKQMVQLIYNHMNESHNWYTKQQLAGWLSHVDHPNIWTNLEAGIGNVLQANSTCFETKLERHRRYYRAIPDLGSLWTK